MPKFHFTQNSFSNSQERPTWLPSLCELFIIYGESKSTGDSIVKQLLIDQQNSAHASVIASDFQISTQNLRIPPKPHKRLWVLRLSRWLPWRESERPPPSRASISGVFRRVEDRDEASRLFLISIIIPNYPAAFLRNAQRPKEGALPHDSTATLEWYMIVTSLFCIISKELTALRWLMERYVINWFK